MLATGFIRTFLPKVFKGQKQWDIPTVLLDDDAVYTI
jgi:hypothetical protein